MSISENIADVGLKLLRETGPMDKNTFLSPVSISCCLAMAYAGADGDTKAQMNEVLFHEMGDETVHTEFSEFMAELNQYESKRWRGLLMLRMVNRIYGKKGIKLMDKFKAILHDKYKAELHFANFASEAEAAQLEINSFVSEQTNNKIKKLIAPAKWATQFKKKMTKDMPFYINEQREETIPMMIAHAVGFQYTENDDVQVLGMRYNLRYDLRQLMFVVILPKDKYNLEAVESNMDGKVMVQLIKSMTPDCVNVYLPKFKMEKSFGLNKALQNMGVVDMFTPSADFSGINGGKDLSVSNVIHKAFIKVNESGTEAAAATAVVFVRKSCKVGGSPPVPKEFQADHPFLFAIVHAETSNALFMGRCADPTGESCCPPADIDNESSSPNPSSKKVSSPGSTDKKASAEAAEQMRSCPPAGHVEMPCQASGPADDAGDKKTVAKKSYCCCCC